MKYAKIENGKLELFTKKYIIVDGRVITNPSSDKLLLAGWKPVIIGVKPEFTEGYAVKEVLNETDNAIFVNYEQHEVEEVIEND